jgi:hypothetical protein
VSFADSIPIQRSAFDIFNHQTVSDMTNYYNGFYNQRWVQEELGARINFTANNYQMQEALFFVTGDPMRVDISYLEHVLNSGVNAALVYGDKDYRCNCMSYTPTIPPLYPR